MNSALLLENFEALVDGESSIKKLQDIVLQLAIQGKLVTQNPDDASVELLLKNVKAERNNLEKQKKIRKVKLSPINLDDEDLYELPNNWIWVKLGQIGDVFNGNSISKSEKEKRYTGIDDGYNYIATKDVDFASRTIAYENGVKIPFEEEKFKIAHKGAVLICAEGGSAGKKIALTEQDVCFGNKLYATEAFSGIVPEYLFYIYQSPFFFKQFSNEMTGIIGGISINKFVDLYIPLPPSEEQNRIVEKIKELFGLLKKLKHKKEHNNQLKKQTVKSSLHSLVRSEISPSFIHDNFNEFFADVESISDLRSTILELSIQGKFSSSKDSLSSKDLLNKISSQKDYLLKTKQIKSFTPITNPSKIITKDLVPSHWELAKVGDIMFVTKLAGFEYTKYFNLLDEGDVPVIRAQNVRPWKIDDTNLKFISMDVSRSLERCALTKKSLLITFIGAGIGDVALFNPDKRWHLAPNVAKAELFDGTEDLLSMEYLILYLNSPVGQKEIFKHIKALAQPSLSMGTIRDIDVLIPPKSEQEQIVAMANQLMELCDELEEQILQSQALNSNLMDSIIHHMMNAA